MATRTLEKLKAKISQLQQEAAALEAAHAKEVAEVVAKMKVAIEHYGLSAADLGLGVPAKKGPRKSATKAATTKTRRATAAKGTAAKKPAGAIKYRDAVGNTWTGNGKRPGWFKAAVESGIPPEDLLVRTDA